MTKEEIHRVNQLLEATVRERTRALEERNRQLADFAFLNAHRMRGPIARVLGLIDLMKMAESRQQEQEYIRYIADSAQELDQVFQTAAIILGSED